jgi:hypothetical protein
VQPVGELLRVRAPTAVGAGEVRDRAVGSAACISSLYFGPPSSTMAPNLPIADRAAAARAVHVRRLVANGFEERSRVVRVECHGHVLGLAVEWLREWPL